jgi:hypothetical protein
MAVDARSVTTACTINPPQFVETPVRVNRINHAKSIDFNRTPSLSSFGAKSAKVARNNDARLIEQYKMLNEVD